MIHFRVLIHGQNFIIEVDGETRPFGFYTTRFVLAEDHDKAEEAAVTMLRDLESLREMVQNPEDDRPEMVIEETEELKSFEGINELEPSLAWYDPEEEEEENEPEENEESTP